MNPVNPGILLPFHYTKNFQRHNQAGMDRHPFGLKAPDKRLLPFQLFFPAGAGVVSWKLANPLVPDGSVDFALAAGDLDVNMKDGGGFWVTWPANSNLTNIPDCGYWEIWLTVDGATYYSEVLHVFEVTGLVVTDWRFRFDNNNQDKAQVLYQIGFKQYYYPTVWAWDRPLVDRDVETTVDGNGAELRRFTRSQTRFRLEVADVPDFVIPFFRKCGDLSVVKFTDGTETDVVDMSNVEFESRPQGLGLNVGVFTFTVEEEAYSGCQELFEYT